MLDDSTIFIGRKPVMNYVLACLTTIQNGSDAVTIKARGRAISTAVDVAQVIVNRFTSNMSVKSIDIDTEQLKNIETGNMSNVSSITIIISK